MNIGITNDHRGLQTKHFLTEYLETLGYNVIDYGTNSEEPADFPDYAKKLGLGLTSNEISLGIAICGTGIGMSIALNKMKGIYCAKVSTTSEAALCKAHNDANVIAISADLSDYKNIVLTFLKTEFSNLEKHKRRIEMIDNYDN